MTDNTAAQILNNDFSGDGYRRAAIDLIKSFYLDAGPQVYAQLEAVMLNLRSLYITYNRESNEISFTLRVSDNPNSKLSKTTKIKFGGPLDGTGPEFGSPNRLIHLNKLLGKEITLIYKMVNNRFTKLHLTFSNKAVVVNLFNKDKNSSNVNVYNVPYFSKTNGV